METYVVTRSLDYGECTKVIAVFAYRDDAEACKARLTMRGSEEGDAHYRVEGPFHVL